MNGGKSKPINEALLADACSALHTTVHGFIERAKLGDVKGMLERGALVQKQMETVAEVVTGTGITP